MRKPRWKKVESSCIDRIRYDKVNRIMHINFHGANEYMYYDVSYYRYRKLLNAESKGRYFNQFVRGHYVFEKLFNK